MADRLWRKVAAVVLPASACGWGRLTTPCRATRKHWREITDWENEYETEAGTLWD